MLCATGELQASLTGLRMVIFLKGFGRQRNERLISSQHPLGESIIATTGNTPMARLEFLRSIQTRATEHARAEWRPPK